MDEFHKAEDTMLIQGTAITVNYEKIEGIKKVYYTNAEILKDYFNEATVLPIPDDAPYDIPRIIIKTLNEHAQLNISPIAATFVVRYNAGFETQWERCAQYLKDRMAKVFEFLNLLTDNKYEYVGLVSDILYDDVQTDGAKTIVNNLLKTQNINDIYDINIKYTFVENDNIYVNIMLQNARLFDHDFNPDKAGAFMLSKQTAESIGITVDINDRFGFNSKVNYKSNSAMLDRLLDSMSNVIDNKLSALVEKGEY